MQINDGTGTQTGARVNSENRLNVESVSRPIEQHINEIYEKTFTLTYDAIDPVGADDYFLYIKNSGTKNLHITHIRNRSTVVGVVEVHHVLGTVSFTAEAAITPHSLTMASSATITGTFSADTDATGLSNDGTLFSQRLAVANTDYLLKVDAHIIVGPGQSVALLWDQTTGALSGSITLYEDQGII